MTAKILGGSIFAVTILTNRLTMPKKNDGGQVVKKTIEDLRTRFAEKYPDKDFSADEDLINDVYGELDANDARHGELEAENTRLRANEEMLTRLFDEHPEAADFLLSMADGKDPIIGLIETFGQEGLQAVIDDPEKAEALAEARKKYRDRVLKEKEYEEQETKNLAESDAVDAELLSSGELTEDELEEAHASLERKLANYLAGKWTAEDLRSELRAANYARDMAEAEQRGEVKGKNGRYVEQRRGRLAGDGMPAMGGGGSRKEAKKSDMGALSKRRRSMWD